MTFSSAKGARPNKPLHIQYIANGTQRDFPFPFRAFANDDIEVCLDTLKQESGYSVNLEDEGNGGDVCFTTAPSAGVLVTIHRSVAFVRNSDFQEGGTLKASVLNNELDRLLALSEQVNEISGRAVKRPITSQSRSSLFFPDPIAGRALKFDENGDIALTDSDIDTVGASASQSATSAATSATSAATSATSAATSATEAATSATSVSSLSNNITIDTEEPHVVFVGKNAGNGSGNPDFNMIGVGNNAASGCGGLSVIAMGYSACYNNNADLVVAIGHDAARYKNATGTSSNTYGNIICLGSFTRATGNNQVILGDTTTDVYGGTYNTRSDNRDKADIEDLSLGLSFITALRPVSYKWDRREFYFDQTEQEVTDADTGETRTETVTTEVTRDGSRKRTRKHCGIIAQELKAVMDAQNVDFGGYQDHSINSGDDVLTVNYIELVPVLIKAVQELTARVEELEA